MRVLQTWMDSRLYPDHTERWDTIQFRDYILDNLKKDFSVLDLGAGRGHLDEMNFKGLVKFVVGVDPDPVVHQNPFLDEAKLLPLPSGEIPYADCFFDIAFSNSVLEHVENPARLFTEIYRILKPNGLFISKTPNRRHYVASIARVTPYYLHKYINNKRGRERQDTYPTWYRCNTPETITAFAGMAGFEVIDVQMWEGRPEYLRLWLPAYFLGSLYERLVNRFSTLWKYRCVIVFSLRKPDNMNTPLWKATHDVDETLITTQE